MPSRHTLTLVQSVQPAGAGGAPPRARAAHHEAPRQPAGRSADPGAARHAAQLSCVSQQAAGQRVGAARAAQRGAPASAARRGCIAACAFAPFAQRRNVARRLDADACYPMQGRAEGLDGHLGFATASSTAVQGAPRLALPLRALRRVSAAVQPSS